MGLASNRTSRYLTVEVLRVFITRVFAGSKGSSAITVADLETVAGELLQPTLKLPKTDGAKWEHMTIRSLARLTNLRLKLTPEVRMKSVVALGERCIDVVADIKLVIAMHDR